VTSNSTHNTEGIELAKLIDSTDSLIKLKQKHDTNTLQTKGT
jgi:hypothetical protein